MDNIHVMFDYYLLTETYDVTLMIGGEVKLHRKTQDKEEFLRLVEQCLAQFSLQGEETK